MTDRFRKFFLLFLLLLPALLPAADGDGTAEADADAAPRAVGWREDFGDTVRQNGLEVPRGWKFDGKKLLVDRTRFYVSDIEPADRGDGKALVIDARQSTGALITIPDADLEKYPILRWRWRVRNLPPGGDGGVPGKDDQAAAVYFGAGGPLSRKSVAYRWETEMPIGTLGWIKYGAGIVTVRYRCIRNKTSPLNQWIVEEVNAAADFRKTYGYLPPPRQYVVSVSGNSQYTDAHTIAEIDYIELVAPPPAAGEDRP